MARCNIKLLRGMNLSPIQKCSDMIKQRVLLVDSHAVAIEGIRNLLLSEPDLEVVAEAGDWWTAVRMVGDIDPDICIMDVSRPGLDGALATRRMKQTNPTIKVIALADDHDLHRLERLLGSGISAYILKRRAAIELVDAIRAVISSGVYLGDSRRSPRDRSIGANPIVQEKPVP
ncbi:MAG: response regulator transcription factor [Gemmatimonadota bacterium]